MSFSEGSFDEVYEVNLAHLSRASHTSSGSLDAICLENDVGTRGLTPPSELNAAASRRYALSLLSRIASLIDVNLDDLLAQLLPSTTRVQPSNSPSVEPISPRSEALMKWGNIIKENLLRTGSNQFIEGVPILRIVDPLALANLYAAAVWPTLATRIQLFEENKCVLEDLIIRSSTGFPILKVHNYQLERSFLKLIEFILSRSSNVHLLIRQDSSENVDPGIEKEVVLGTPLVKLVDPNNTTIPFIDESRLTVSPILADPGIDNGPLEAEKRHSTSFGDNAAPIILRSTNSFSSEDVENRVTCECDEMTVEAIQLALLLLPLELRFQLQVFFEQAQEIVTNSKRHLRPETTLEYVQPSMLAYWFSVRFFPSSKGGSTETGRVLIEFLLSQPNPLSLFKTPKSCLDGGLFGSGDIINPSPHRHTSHQHHRLLPQAKAPTALAGIKKNTLASAGGENKVKAAVDVAVATGGSKISRRSLLTIPSRIGFCEKVEPEEATNVHISQMLEYFEGILKHKSMPIATKLNYVKQFEKTHPDIFWLHFKSPEEARECIEDLKRQAATQESHSQSPSRFANRLLHLFKRAPRSRSAGRSGLSSMED